MTGILIGLVVFAVAIGHWPVAVAIAAGTVVAAWRLGRKTLLFGGLALVAAWWIGMAGPDPFPHGVEPTQGWRLEVTSMPQLRQHGWAFQAVIRDGPAAGQHLLVYASDERPISLHDRIYAYGTVQIRDGIPGSYGGYLDGLGVAGQLYVGQVEVDRAGHGLLSTVNRIRAQTVTRLLQAVPGDAGALLAGFVTGDDGQLSDQSDDVFRRAGLSHLTAVSGSNLAMLVTMVAAVGRFSGRRRTTLIIIGAVVAWSYAVFVGLSPPTLRAALMVTFVAGGRLAGRPIDVLNLALITCAIQIGLRPVDASSISFLLSTAASVGLAAGLSRYPLGGRRMQLTDLVYVAACAQIATLPFIAGTFGDVPLLAIAANIVAVPLATFAFPVALVGAVLLWLPWGVGIALLIPAAWAAEGVLGVAQLYGQEWSVVHLNAVAPALAGAALALTLMALLMVGGEVRLLRRQFAAVRGKSP